MHRRPLLSEFEPIDQPQSTYQDHFDLCSCAAEVLLKLADLLGFEVHKEVVKFVRTPNAPAQRERAGRI
jgi:hypothetical protein